MDLLDKIIKAKEVLGDDIAIKIAEYLHIEKFDKHSLKGCCPFHKEDTPSFIWDKKDKCYSCFSGETEVITKDGVFPIIEIIDKEVEIINGNGEWEKVKFVNCGKQKLIKINLTSNGKIKEIFATPEHEWIVRKHKAKIQTKDLKSGYRLERVLPIRDRNFNIIPEGIIHGYVYGDGHISKRTDKKFRFCTTVYTKEKYDFIKQFVKITKPKCFEKNEKYKECFGYFHISSVINFKEIPDFKCHSLDYLYSFLIGYFVTDGCAKPSTTKNCNNALFASAKYDDLVKVKHICTLVGIATYPIGHTIRTPKSNGGILNYTHNHDIYYLRLVHSTIPNNFYLSSKKNDRKFTYSSYLGWKVVSIEETERYEDVYCTETSTHSFALKDFILTGNCFGCGRRYGIIDMYTETEGSYQSALKKLFKETGIEDKFSLNNNNEDYFKNYRFPKEETNTDRSRVDAYMAKRGISKETLDYAGIKQDQHGNVVFELRDFDNKLLAVKYRQSRAVPKGQAKMWYQKNADTCPSLFNLQNIDITQPLLITEGYCFSDTVQVLTKNGWIYLKDYNNEEVMQYNSDGTSEFITPLAYIKKEYQGLMYEVNIGENYYTCITPDHQLVLKQRNGTNIKKIPISEMGNNNDHLIPTCANYNNGCGINLTDDEIRLQVAFSADGSFSNGICYKKNGEHRIRFNFQKRRKADRLREILKKLDIDFTETIQRRDDYRYGICFYFSFIDKKKIFTKDYNMSWISLLTPHQRKVLLDEIRYWDGYYLENRNRSEFYSTNKNNYEFIQTLCHISGYMATINRKKYKNHQVSVNMLYGKSYITWQKVYERNNIKIINYNGMVYCLQVPSGMLLVRQNEKISVSGNCDALSALEAGYRNVVSIPSGATDLNWIEFNWDILEQIPEFILWFDNDRAGETGRTQTQQRLGEYRCKLVKPSQDDIAAVRAFYEPYGTIIEKTDANNILVSCGSQRILDLISQAEEIPSKKLKYLMDCEIESIKDLEKFSTGIKKIDDILYGNIMGNFTIFSARAGDGKSSLANIMSLIAGMENGYKVFVFSGELGVGQLADWIISPLAGSNHIIESKSNSQRNYYSVTEQAKKEIRDYYKKNIIVYNDDNALDVSGSSIIQAMEEAYKRNGCRVFLIDNLMCISMEQQNQQDDKWDTQKQFIIRLMNFTKKYNVSTNLIVHPRKMNAGTEVTTDSLYGSSNISNLCHRLLWLQRLKPEESSYNMVLTVIKDRYTQSAGKKCELYYDERTRRIYSDLDELKRKYSWEKQVHIQYSQEEDKHLVYHQLPIALPHEKSNYEPF